MVETILGAETRIAEKETEQGFCKGQRLGECWLHPHAPTLALSGSGTPVVRSPTKSFPQPVLQFCSWDIFVSSGIQSIHA